MSRLELGLVAAALLLPVPLVALNGYAAALPDAVGRGLGSLVTLEAEDKRSGVEADGDVSEDGNDTQRSGHAALAIRRAGTSGEGKATPNDSGGDDAANSTDEEKAGATPQEDDPERDGGTDGSGPSTEDSESSDNGGASSDPSPGIPTLSLTAGGQGTLAGVSAGPDGVTVDTDAESAGAGDSSGVGVEVSEADGSSTNVGIDVPGTGAVLP